MIACVKFSCWILCYFATLFHAVASQSYLDGDFVGYQRFKRQADAGGAAGGGGLEDESRTLVCDFGSGSLLSECSWTYPIDGHPNVRWNKGQGTTAYWLGGPLVDHTLGDSNGKWIPSSSPPSTVIIINHQQPVNKVSTIRMTFCIQKKRSPIYDLFLRTKD